MLLKFKNFKLDKYDISDAITFDKCSRYRGIYEACTISGIRERASNCLLCMFIRPLVDLIKPRIKEILIAY